MHGRHLLMTTLGCPRTKTCSATDLPRSLLPVRLLVRSIGDASQTLHFGLLQSIPPGLDARLDRVVHLLSLLLHGLDEAAHPVLHLKSRILDIFQHSCSGLVKVVAQGQFCLQRVGRGRCPERFRSLSRLGYQSFCGLHRLCRKLLALPEQGECPVRGHICGLLCGRDGVLRGLPHGYLRLVRHQVHVLLGNVDGPSRVPGPGLHHLHVLRCDRLRLRLLCKHRVHRLLRRALDAVPHAHDRLSGLCGCITKSVLQSVHIHLQGQLGCLGFLLCLCQLLLQPSLGILGSVFERISRLFQCRLCCLCRLLHILVHRFCSLLRRGLCLRHRLLRGHTSAHCLFKGCHGCLVCLLSQFVRSGHCPLVRSLGGGLGIVLHSALCLH
mmetsp:Transcript_29970/g.69707  ORF Transcript_29970/g.69707 Transcript_29970/m.69707 type:complete len:382 (+) Transcript_29970:175-1320(+)